MELLDKDAALIGLDEVVRLIKVVSPYGLQAKKTMKLYGPSEREDLIADVALLAQFVKAQKSKPDFFSQLRSRLTHLKALGESIENARQDIALSQVELFDIKGMILTIKGILKTYSSFIEGLPLDLQLRLPEASSLALDPKGEGLESFYISDDYSEDLASVRQRIKALEGDIKKERLACIKAIVADYGNLRFRPNGVAIVSKSDRESYNKLVQDPRLMIVDEHYETVSFGVMANDIVASLQRKIESLKWEEEQETYKVRLELSRVIGNEYLDFQWSFTALGNLDLYIAKAALAIGVNGVKPEFVSSGEGITIEAGRHVGVEQRLRRENKGYTPVSVRFDTPVALITGANMGGKTIALKMIGLCVAMAHMGLFVPARVLKTPVLNYLVAVIGDEQSVDLGLSTFGSEVVSLIRAIDQSDREGLILVDELARGTNPKEGAALSKSIISYLTEKKCYAVITTHFDGLVSPEHKAVRHWQVKGLKALQDTPSLEGLAWSDLSKMMDYALELVEAQAAVPHEALRIASLMGLPKCIVDKASLELQNQEVKGAQ